MKFMSIRELRASTNQIKKMLSGDDKIVLTTNGKPTALMIEVNEDNFEDIIIDLRVMRARRAIRLLQRQSVETGLDRLTLDDINDEIAEARREAT